MMIENVLTRLDNVRTSGQGYSARCPAHNDKSPSLYVSQGEDRVLIHCFAGCDVKDICHAIGLEVSDLFNKKIEPAKRKEIKVKHNTRSKFERLRLDAFKEMATFRRETRELLDVAGTDIPDEVVPAVHMLPKIDYWLSILATGTKEEVIDLLKEGVIRRWAGLSILHQKKQNLSTWSMSVST